METTSERKPGWIRFKIPGGEKYTRVKNIIRKNKLHTVCLEAGCPNIGECFGCGTATFLIMGNICTRNCLYCAVSQGTPESPDADEPENIASAVKELELKYAVITSVTRDDIPDGGSSIFAKTATAIKTRYPQCRIELLVPDFKTVMESSLDTIIAAGPHVINHNIEVVSSLYKQLRPAGDYELSLRLLSRAAAAGIPAKSGLMIGFGETIADIEKTFGDLYAAGCRILTVGQYLQSRKNGFPVNKYYTPEEFTLIGDMAKNMGFERVMSGPLIRSSYHAADMSE